MIWCVVLLATSLESNRPSMCFQTREQCRAYIAAMALDAAQCNRRSGGG